MGTTNWCLRRGRLGSFRTCPRHLDIGSPNSFVSEDDWKTPFGEVWGDLPRLLRQWRIPSLGTSLFLSVLCLSFFLCSFCCY